MSFLATKPFLLLACAAVLFLVIGYWIQGTLTTDGFTEQESVLMVESDVQVSPYPFDDYKVVTEYPKTLVQLDLSSTSDVWHYRTKLRDYFSSPVEPTFAGKYHLMFTGTGNACCSPYVVDLETGVVTSSGLWAVLHDQDQKDVLYRVDSRLFVARPNMNRFPERMYEWTGDEFIEVSDTN